MVISDNSSNKDWIAVLNDGRKNIVGTGWVADELPKITILVVHGKGVAAERKIEPHLGYVVCDVICNCRAREAFNMLSKLSPRANSGKLRKLAGTIEHPGVEES